MKLGGGVQVAHHSALHYLALHSPKSALAGTASLTINDTNVLQEYHEDLIPKAIEYSAGILDYFFRGHLDVWAQWDEEGETYVMNISNTGLDAFSGGQFTLLREAADGTRTPVDLALASDGHIPAGGSVQGTFRTPGAGSHDLRAGI